MKLLYIFIPLIFLTGCAAVSTKGYEQYVGKAVFDIPSTYNSREVVDGIYDSIAWRSSNLQKFEGFMPEELPDKPGRPVFQRREFGLGYTSMAFIDVKCGDNALVSMSGQEDELKSGFGTYERGGYRVCIYPYKNGYRVYIVGIYTYSEKSGLSGLMAKAVKKTVTKAVCKGFEHLYDCWFNQIIEKVQERFPDSKTVSIDYPVNKTR